MLHFILPVVAGVLGLLYLVLLGLIVFTEKGRRSCGLALRSLWLHKLRSSLSVLGIIIGTAAVISLMAFGEGSMHDALEDIKRLGATNVIIRSVKPPDESSAGRQTRIAVYGLTRRDHQRFRTIPTVVRDVPMRVLTREVSYLTRRHNARIVGTEPAYAQINQLELAAGRFLSDEDGRKKLNVAVLGWDTAEKLFPFEDPIGHTIDLGGKHQIYKVVGVVRERMPTGGGGGSQAAENFNSDVYMPLATCDARFGERDVNRRSGSFSAEQVELTQVTLTISDMNQVRPAGQVVRDMLERNHDRKDWDVTVPLDRLEEAERAQARYTMLLVLIASISLLVGGIGIMNIMLASVTERTREIGVRRALGAKRKDITLQFLIEAAVQTNLGGLAGVVLGLTLVYLIPLVWGWITKENVPAKLNIWSFPLSLGVAVGVGVLFGWYPSMRAARLDPIEALRHE